MKSKVKLDGIGGSESVSYQDRVRSKLNALKQDVLAAPQIIAQKSLLTGSRRVFFALGLRMPSGMAPRMAFFGVGGVLVLSFFVAASFLQTTGQFSKQVLGTATTGLEFLQRRDFAAAASSFADARNQIQNSSDIVIRIIDASPLGENVEQLFTAADLLLISLNRLTLGVKEFENVRLLWDANTNSTDPQLYHKIKSSRDQFLQSAKSLREVEALLGGINGNLLPSEYRGSFSQARSHLASARQVMEEVVAFETFALSLLGGEKKTYVLIFQNNNEIRATGGFIGTYGILELGNGQMSIRKIESIYEIDGQLREKIAAPGPLLRQAANLWGMRDANWFVDFPNSSRKILEFFEKETGILAEGVISFTPDVFERLLQITGPISMPEYGEELRADNFREVAQYKTSIDYDKRLNQPKKFLADFVPRFLGKFSTLKTDQALTVYQILSDMVEHKHLLLFSLDPGIQSQIREYRAAGDIKQTDGDYLGIFHSSVGGGKTDQSILQQVHKEVTLTPRGKIQVRLRITRTHQGFEEKYFPKNLDFMRILVPVSSQLLSASGFDDYELKPSIGEGVVSDSDLGFWDRNMIRDEEHKMYIGQEAGYRVFANWQELLPGETKTIELVYDLPIAQAQNYSLVVQKQPGARPYQFTLKVNQANSVSYYYPPEFAVAGSSLNISEEINSDKFYGVIWR